MLLLFVAWCKLPPPSILLRLTFVNKAYLHNFWFYTNAWKKTHYIGNTSSICTAGSFCNKAHQLSFLKLLNYYLTLAMRSSSFCIASRNIYFWSSDCNISVGLIKNEKLVIWSEYTRSPHEHCSAPANSGGGGQSVFIERERWGSKGYVFSPLP